MPECCTTSLFIPDQKFKKTLQNAIDVGNIDFFEKQADMGGNRVRAIVYTPISNDTDFLLNYAVLRKQINLCIYLLENKQWNKFLYNQFKTLAADINNLAIQADRDSPEENFSFATRVQAAFSTLKIKIPLLTQAERSIDSDDSKKSNTNQGKLGCLIS